MWSVLQASERQETSNVAGSMDHVGSELPLTLFDVAHPGLTVVKVDMF